MIFKKTSILWILVLTVYTINCGSAQKKEEPKPVVETAKPAEKVSLSSEGGSPEALLEDMNKKLDERKVTGYKKNQTSLANTEWIEKSLPVLKELSARIPDGYVLLIEGHTDQSGSDEINQDVSTGRAKTLYDKLVKNGISSDKLKYQGVGTKYLIDEPYSEKNRRVTFKITKRN
ncbi:MAG: OmpA family protein [Spirochaetia bacterium]|nr:OmpA family protein [Spirochaetia bacterium]